MLTRINKTADKILLESQLDLEFAVEQFRANPKNNEVREFLKRAFHTLQLAEKLAGVNK